MGFVPLLATKRSVPPNIVSAAVVLLKFSRLRMNGNCVISLRARYAAVVATLKFNVVAAPGVGSALPCQLPGTVQYPEAWLFCTVPAVPAVSIGSRLPPTPIQVYDTPVLVMVSSTRLGLLALSSESAAVNPGIVVTVAPLFTIAVALADVITTNGL